MPRKKASKKPAKSAPKRPAPRGKARVSLAPVFAALGARDPASWGSRSEGALERFVLLRALWMKTVEPGRLLARARTHKLVGPAIDRMVRTVDLADLDALVRLAQEQAMRDVLAVLDDPADVEGGVSWGVFRKDKRGKAGPRLSQLAPDVEEAKP